MLEKLKIGLFGSSQLSFPGDKQAVFEKSSKGLEALSSKLDFELVIYPTTVVTEKDADSAVNFMENQKVDFLLAQTTSFSSGFIAMSVSKIKNACLGIWAVPENASEGVVQLNSFCSLNMFKSIIDHYCTERKVKCKWFYGDVDSPDFLRRFEVTVSAVRAIKGMKNANIALVGGLAPGFNDLYFDERGLQGLFPGFKINRLHEFSEIKDRALSYTESEVEKAAQKMVNEANGIIPQAQETLKTSARVYLAFKAFLKEYGYDALAVSCWPKFQEDFRYSVCSVVAALNDEGIPTACEGDLVSAVSMLALKYLSGDETMLMDLSGFDESDQSVLLWHCGPASRRFAPVGGYTLGVNYTGMPHEKGKPLNCCGVTRDMVFDPAHVTVMRLAGDNDRYLLLEGDFMGNKKKSFTGSRGWLTNLKLNGEPIDVKDLVNTILVSGFQHHYPIALGPLADEVNEFAAWLGIKPIKEIRYSNSLQIID